MRNIVLKSIAGYSYLGVSTSLKPIHNTSESDYHCCTCAASVKSCTQCYQARPHDAVSICLVVISNEMWKYFAICICTGYYGVGHSPPLL